MKTEIKCIDCSCDLGDEGKVFTVCSPCWDKKSPSPTGLEERAKEIDEKVKLFLESIVRDYDKTERIVHDASNILIFMDDFAQSLQEGDKGKEECNHNWIPIGEPNMSPVECKYCGERRD